MLSKVAILACQWRLCNAAALKDEGQSNPRNCWWLSPSISMYYIYNTSAQTVFVL